MSAMLQIIAVMKTLGAITPKDHSIAPVNQGTMEMDTIVQVKSSACVWLTYPLVSFKKLRSGNLFFFGRTRKHSYWRYSREGTGGCSQAKYVYYMK